ncbi:MAG: S41 family peptidase [Deltaproteobacteria bacterium]|nr:S41 family peptidase [Deltaproteobacteria bacterium]
MRTTFIKKGVFSFIIILFITLLILPGFYEDKSAFSAGNDTYKNLKLFNEILDLIETNYVEEVDPGVIIDGAITGMIKTLDPHSAYMSAETYKELRINTKGAFGGLGIEITMVNEVVTVVSPIEDTPAFTAGIKSGDQIIGIDGKTIKGLTLEDAVHKLRGKAGTEVTITIRRKGLDKPKDFIITRAVIEIKSVKHKVYHDNIGYLRISNFQETTTTELNKALNSLIKEVVPLKGLILDLRNNPGGVLEQSIKVSDAFLKSGVIVSTKGRAKKSGTVYTAKNDGDEPECPIIVLINGASASASEIVSGALQDNERALLLGTQTFGKASMQVIIPLNNGAALKLTTGKYYTPSGRLIQAKGISPDIEIEYASPDGNKERPKQIRESDLKGHIEGDKETEEAKKPERKPDDLTDDNQLSRAIDILKSWEIFSRMNKR